MERSRTNRIKQVGELREVAGKLLQTYPDSRIFAFYGPMGVGKTTFIKYLCELLGVSELVSSPSFPIVNHYLTSRGKDIYHFDFFRIKNHEEVYDLGYEHYFYSGNYCFIEWPEKIEPLMPEEVVPVVMEMNHEGRLITF